MRMRHWYNEKGELGTHSYAGEPYYQVHMNGKVDINPQTGKADNKIELTVNGMQVLVKDWIASGHQLSREEKAELIDVLAKSGKATYDTISQEWIIK